MSFTSPAFIGFIALLVLLYYLVPRRFQWMLLLAASYVFYLCGGARTIVWLLAETVLTYTAARLLDRLNAQKKNLPAEERKAALARIKRAKRRVVAFAALISFGMLYVIKYWDFTAQALDGLGLELPRLELLMPLGVSFFIFQSVGYVIDVYRERVEAEKNIAKYALFTSFFPQIVQGPISRFDQLAPQLTAGHDFDADELKYGIQLAMWGYFKKLVIAERAGVIVNTVFAAYTEMSGSVIAVAVLMYCIQLYCDFSGGIDISRSVAQMLGIRMAENFRRPIMATSLTDFWRRWHITLGAWMKDYLFYPLSLSRPMNRFAKFARRHVKGRAGKVLATSLATFTVYFVIGVWHGANFRYIAYGFYNGALITAALLLEGPFAALKARIGVREDSGAYLAFCRVRTWLIVFVGRYITRAPRLLTAVAMLHTTLTRFAAADLVNGRLLTLGLGGFDLAVVAVATAVMLLVEFLQERGVQMRRSLEQRSFLVQWAAILVPLVVILLLGVAGGNYVAAEFIYAQF